MNVGRIAVARLIRPHVCNGAKKHSPSIDEVGWSGDPVYLIVVEWMNLGPWLAVLLSGYAVWRLAGEPALTAMGCVSLDVNTALHTD